MVGVRLIQPIASWYGVFSLVVLSEPYFSGLKDAPMMALRKPAPVFPELEYTVRNGLSGMRLTKPLVTLAEADAASWFFI